MYLLILHPYTVDILNMASNPNKSQASVNLSDTKHVSISVYKDQVYFHIWDMRKVKSVSLQSKELEKIIARGPKMIKFGEELLKKELTNNKTKKPDKKTKKESYKVELDMDTSSGSEVDTLE